MKLVLFSAGLCIAVTLAAHVPDVFNEDDIIRKVENSNALWKAGRNFGSNTPYSYIKRLMGTKKSEFKLPLKIHNKLSDLPENFDARKQWSNCTVIGEIRDQGNCGSCWAASTTGVFSDRLCIASGGTINIQISIEELNSCCVTCGNCGGGSPDWAWFYMMEHGLVSGGAYQSNVGCQPYEVQGCEHHSNGTLPKCSDLPPSPTPNCVRNCTNPSYKTPFHDDHHFGSTAYSLFGEEQIKEDIYNFGSVVAAFFVMEDLLTYKSGVYHHVTGKGVGGHAVRIIGWGVEEDTPYWLVANSWNEDWGDKGLFKILRGNNECGIEENITAGKSKGK